MNFRILIMGLPGSGKTTLANELALLLSAHRVNADEVRRAADDWDFSEEGRLRQAARMKAESEKHDGIVIADFVCPTPETLAAFDPHYTIWMNTIQEGRFEDTNKVFVKPEHADCTFNTFWNRPEELHQLVQAIYGTIPQGVMIGRYQPFHDGHKALFEEILAKHGYVTIMVRATARSESNPFGFYNVAQRINAALQDYEGRFTIMQVPNVAGVYYGRDVGYAVEKIELPDNVTSISATRIREQLKAEREVARQAHSDHLHPQLPETANDDAAEGGE